MTITGNAALAAQNLAAGGSMGAGRPIIGVVIGIIFAFICYRIAEGKGRSGILYGILGFFFSIITFIVILILPRKR